MFFTKRVLVLLLVLVIVVELGEAQKKSKNSKGKNKATSGSAAKKSKKKGGGGGKNKGNKNKNKGGGKNKNKNKNKNKQVGIVKQPYVRPDDEKFWPSGGLNRVWTELDSPRKNPEFMAAFDDLTATLKSYGIPLSKLTAMQVMANTTLVDKWFDAMSVVEEIATPTFVLTDPSGNPNGYTFSVHLDSKGGTDLPPILENYCTVPECVATGVKYIGESGFYAPVSAYPMSEVYKEKLPKLTERLLDDLMDKLNSNLGTFTLDATSSMICTQSYTNAAHQSVAASLNTIEQVIPKFSKKPGQTTKFQAEREILTLHEDLTAHLFSQLLNNVCK